MIRAWFRIAMSASRRSRRPGEAMARCVKLRVHGVVTGRECLALLYRAEVVSRQLAVLQSDLINELGALAGPAELGGTLAHALADRLRIGRAEARRRIGEAEDLGARATLAGEVLAPRLAATATAQRAGRIGAEHVAPDRGVSQAVAGLGGGAHPGGGRGHAGRAEHPVSPRAGQ